MAGIASFINKQAKSKDVGTAIVNSIETSLKLLNPPSRSTRPNIKPSKLQCERQMYYILTQAPTDPIRSTDPKLIMMQKVGTFMHSLIQEALASSHAKAQGIIFRTPEDVVAGAALRGLHTRIVPSTHSRTNQYECHSYNEDYGISFMWDGGIYFRDTKAIIEIKSEEHFKHMKRMKPDPEHIEQATCYSICLGIDTVIFLYVDRNYMTIKSYQVEIDDMMKSEVIAKINRVKQAVADRVLPAKCEGKKPCKYCDYCKACKADLNPSPQETD